MSLVKSPDMYSIQTFCDIFLDFCPIINGDKDELRKLLDENGYKHLKVTPLIDIEEVIKNNRPVVLVDCSYISDTEFDPVENYRWVEIPKEE